MAKKRDRKTMSICLTCDTHYEDSNAEERKVHDHPEPQSGAPAVNWIRSGLEYFLWTQKTPEGREWAARRRLAGAAKDGTRVGTLKVKDFHVYLSDNLAKRVQAIAKRECRSVNQQIVFWILEALEAPHEMQENEKGD